MTSPLFKETYRCRVRATGEIVYIKFHLEIEGTFYYVVDIGDYYQEHELESAFIDTEYKGGG